MITLVGLGAGGAHTLSRGAEQALRDASTAMRSGRGSLFLRTDRHPSVATLREWGLRFETFDSIYDNAPDFAGVYAAIADRVIEATDSGSRDACYATPGHPLIGEESVRQVLQRARDAGFVTRIVSSGSLIEAVLSAVGIPLDSGCAVVDAQALAGTGQAAGSHMRPDVSRPLILFHAYDTASASMAKLALMRDYPDDWEVLHVLHAGIAGEEQVKPIPLFRLDREPMDHLSSIYIPPLPAETRRADFDALVTIMNRLRSPGGCPWDREQTHQSLKRYMVEETYEVLDAIDARDDAALTEELGDALLQVVFQAQLAGERDAFDIDDVTEAIVTKLIRRHPHVFGSVSVSGSAEVLQNWEKIKRDEKASGDAASVLDGVPSALPSLTRAELIGARAARVGFDWQDVHGILDKLDEEVREVKAAVARESSEPDLAKEIGDLLFTVAQLARRRNIDPEESLRAMIGRFTARFRLMEQRAAERGGSLDSLSPEEWDALWNAAKSEARNNEAG